CIGLAIGAGLYVSAIVSTILILFVLIYFVKIEQKFTGMREYKGLVLVVQDQPGQVGNIGSILGDMGVLIKNIQLERLEDDNLEIELLVQLPPHVLVGEIIEELSKIKGFRSIDRLN
ncbi:MAG: methyltransferase, partial [Syntrophomonadaceae bacterium]